MNIAYVFGTYPQWSETFLQREMDALADRGFDVEIWAMQARALARQLPGGGWKQWQKYFFSAAYYREVGRELAARLHDVTHLHAAWAGFPAQIAMAAAEAKGITWSFSGHSRDLWVTPRLLSEKIAAAAFATACTQQGVAFLRSQNPAHAAKVLFAPHGLPLGDFPFTQRQHFYPPHRVLAVGRLVEKKGFEYLLRALRILQKRGNCPETTILGAGPQRRALEKLASELKLTHLYFEGAVPPAKVRAHMQRASILVAPCITGKDGDHDGLPNVLLEAAALGLPILTTPVGGTGDLITGETGWLCPPQNASALAESLEGIFRHPHVAFRKTQRAREVVERHYDINRNIDRLAGALRRCAEKE